MLFKARFCLRGDKQVAYRDFGTETLYAPVARHETIPMFLAKVAAQDLILEVLSVAAAHLNGELKKLVIMELPTNYSGIPRKPNHVALVEMSIFGQIKAGNIWGTDVHTKFVPWGFR